MSIGSGKPSLRADKSKMPVVKAFFDEATFTISYVVRDPQSSCCAIVDSVLDYDPASGRTNTVSADAIVAFVREEGLTVQWILETHVHADHLTASAYLQEQLKAPLGIVRQRQQVYADAGRAWTAVQAALRRDGPPGTGCALHALPLLTQTAFDHLLQASDLNFVRGEDSLTRALWVGQPFVWHIYPQHDHAHHAKLHAFLDWLQAPASLRAFHLAWNGITAATPVWPDAATLADWRDCTQAARQRLLVQPDLCSQLTGFVREKR